MNFDFLEYSFNPLSEERPNGSGFRILSILVREGDKLVEMLLYPERKNHDGAAISLVIGPNGVGKSYLLRAIIEFFFDFHFYSKTETERRKNNFRFSIEEIAYCWESDHYRIKREQNGFSAFKDNLSIGLNKVEIPSIVAVHFGLYDRFPIKRMGYDMDFYKYVGAKASSNFITANNIITQMLFVLSEERDEIMLDKLKKTFWFVGYDPLIIVTFSFKENLKINSFFEFNEFLKRQENINNSFNAAAIKRIRRFDTSERKSLYDDFRTLQKRRELRIEIDAHSFYGTNRLFSSLYLLKQLLIVSKINYKFFKNGNVLNSNCLSSGEINLLATIVSITASLDRKGTLVLLDEPELSQHPNWQMGLISMLFSIFGDSPCHLLVATHSHFLASDLPKEKSAVIRLDYNPNLGIQPEMISENTFGWSPEQILLKVFNTATDRNIYLAEMIGILLDKIKDDAITYKDVEKEIRLLSQLRENLRDIDPLKTIINSLISTFERH